MAQSLHYLTSNVKGGAQERWLNGRLYLVADTTLIVPGVLPGSRGPLYYPPDEVSKDVAVWNAMPLVLYHPQNAEGQPTSARDPDILGSQGMGFVFNSTFKGKLRAQSWFDVALTENHDEKLSEELKILPRLRAGKPIEVSTGLFTRDEPVTNGVHNGKKYKAVARDYKPDHVAVLPDMRGACSLADGCGVHNAKSDKGEEDDKYEKAGKGFESDEQRRAFFGHLAGAGGKGPRSKKGGGGGGSVTSPPPHYSEATHRTGTHDEAARRDYTKANKQIAKARTEQQKIKAGPSGFTESQHATYAKHQQIIEQATKVRDAAVKYARLPKTPTPAQSSDRTTQTVPAPEKQPTAREEAQYKAASSVADLLAERMKAGGDVPARMERAGAAHYKRSSGFRQHFDSAEHAGKAVRAAYEAGLHVDREARKMKRNARKKKPSSKLDMSSEKACQILKDGQANGKPLTDAQRGMFGAKCGQGRKRKDNAHLTGNAMKGGKCHCDDCKSDRRSKRKRRLEMAANITNNQADNRSDTVNKAQKVQWLTTNCDCWKNSKAQLEGMDDATLDKLIAREQETATLKGNLAKPVKAGDSKMFIYNAATGTFEEQPPPPPPPQQQTQNTTKPAGMSEWLAAMPDEAKPVWNAMTQAHNDAKAALVNNLVSRLPEGEREAERASLVKLHIEELKRMAKFAGVTANAAQPDVLMPLYAGAGGAPTTNAFSPVGDAEALELPVNNWGADDSAARRSA